MTSCHAATHEPQGPGARSARESRWSIITPERQTQQKDRPGRIPDFANREEEAAWFETHDLADYQDEFRAVDARFATHLSAGIHIRLDPQTLAALRCEARQKGIGPTTLARMWIMEHLQHQHEQR